VSKATFVLRFLLLFAVVIAIGWAIDGSRHYARALKATARVTSPVATGWWLEERVKQPRPELWYRSEGKELQFPLSLESLSLGLLPFFALLSATPRLTIRHRVFAAVIGTIAFFLLDLIVVLLYPLLVSQPNALTDITGTFLGLLTFVGAPIILWFMLTFSHLRDIWRLDGPMPRVPKSAAGHKSRPRQRSGVS
jgi:hypothetical protein